MALTQVQGQMLNGSTNTTTTIQSNGTTAITIDASQNVCIGTGTAVEKLTVSASGITSGINLTNTGTSGRSYSIFSTSSGAATVGSLGFYDATAAAYRMVLDSSGHVLPGANGTQNFGSSSLRWANLYTSDLHLSNGIGNYTIVEGEEDLFLYNNKNGKTYKFALIEVDPSTAPAKMKE